MRSVSVVALPGYVLALVLATAACGPASVQEQVKGYSTGGRRYSVGQVDASFRAVDGHETARGPNSDSPLYWGGYDGSRMCVVHKVDYQIFQTPAETLAENYAAGLQKVRVSFALYDGYDAIPAEGPPPQAAESRLTVNRPYTVPMESLHGETVHRPRWEGAAEICVSAPTIAASNRLVVVKSVAPDKTSVFVWEIQGAPVAAASGAPAEAVSSQATPASASAPASANDIVETLKEQKGYLAFLTVVECAGKTAELASGTFNVLAFSDATVLRVMPNKKERLGLKKKPDECLAIYNAHVSKRVTMDGGTISATGLDGKTHEVKLDTALPVIETTNGTVFPVPEMWRP